MKIIDKFKILTYNVGFIRKNIDDIMLDGVKTGDIIWLKHKYKDRYFADPFLLKQDSKNFYLLCEEYIFWEEKGKIVLLTVDRENFELKEHRLLIEENYHLSFPYCKINGTWILPEASVSGAAYAYKINTESMQVQEKIKIANVGLIDNVVYEDKGGRWIYAGREKAPNIELYEFKQGENGEFYINRQNPLQSDRSCSRGAGDFFSYRGKVYRGVQDCEVRYGRQTKIMEMIHLGVEGYEAKEVATLNSFENPPFNETMHTFNVYNDIIIVDGSKDFFRFPMKIFYKKCRWLFRRKN